MAKDKETSGKEAIPPDKIISSMKETMEKTLQHLQKEMKGIRAGRVAPSFVEHVEANAYGSMLPLRDLAQISAPEARQLLIKPRDTSNLKEIEKALLAANLGVTPQNDGKLIRLNFPLPSEESRKKSAKDIKAKGESAKTSIRNIRSDAIKKLETQKKDKLLSEDALKKWKDEVQKLLKDYELKVDNDVKKKTDEVMAI